MNVKLHVFLLNFVQWYIDDLHESTGISGIKCTLIIRLLYHEVRLLILFRLRRILPTNSIKPVLNITHRRTTDGWREMKIGHLKVTVAGCLDSWFDLVHRRAKRTQNTVGHLDVFSWLERRIDCAMPQLFTVQSSVFMLMRFQRQSQRCACDIVSVKPTLSSLKRKLRSIRLPLTALSR